MPLNFLSSRTALWLAALWLGLMHPCAAQPTGGVLPVPELSARVMDQTGTLSGAQRQQLEDKLAAFEASNGTQIVILLVPTTQPEDVAAYANRVFNAWKPGRKGIGDGLLLVVAKQDRKMRVEVSRALEGAVPDLAAKRIIDEVLTPSFRQGDFAGGLEQASERLMALVRGEGLPEPAPRRAASDETDWMNLAVLLFIALPVLGSIMRRILGHKLGTLATGGVIGYLTFMFTTSLLLAGAAAVLGMLLSFVAGTSLGSALLSSGRRGGPWGGGTGGDWGSGGFGGGGGGFSSGGGGDGAGGGASGDW
jgi:uncharacterized protein